MEVGGTERKGERAREERKGESECVCVCWVRGKRKSKLKTGITRLRYIHSYIAFSS